MTALTICIPTIPSRRSLLSRLLNRLEPQLTDDIEVLISDGERPMGDKLNQMFTTATGRYVVAIDDDDLVVEDYITALPLQLNVDFIGHDILWMENGETCGIVKHSLAGDPLWRTFDRAVSPKCPVRTELARCVQFGNEYTSDRIWSLTVYKAALTGAYVQRALYIYDHWDAHMVGTDPTDPRFDRPQRDVGSHPYDPAGFTWLAA